MSENTQSSRNESVKDGSSIGVRPPKIYQTCWNEKAHKLLGPVHFNGYEFAPCPECGTIHKVTHRIDNGE